MGLIFYTLLCSYSRTGRSFEVDHTFKDVYLEQVYNEWFNIVWRGTGIESGVRFVEENKSLTPLIPSNQIKNERIIFMLLRETILEIEKGRSDIHMKYTVNSYIFASEYFGNVYLIQIGEDVHMKWSAKWKANQFSYFGTDSFLNVMQGLFADLVTKMSDSLK